MSDTTAEQIRVAHRQTCNTALETIEILSSMCACRRRRTWYGRRKPMLHNDECQDRRLVINAYEDVLAFGDTLDEDLSPENVWAFNDLMRLALRQFRQWQLTRALGGRG